MQIIIDGLHTILRTVSCFSGTLLGSHIRGQEGYEKLQLQNAGVIKITRGEIEGPLKSFGTFEISSGTLPSIYDDWSLKGS